jgi:hypothetical protein
MRVQISHHQEVASQFELLRGLFNVTSLELLGFSMMVCLVPFSVTIA